MASTESGLLLPEAQDTQGTVISQVRQSLPLVMEMWTIFWPTFVALVFQYSTSLVSVAFCGHLGEDELGSVGLANSVIMITGIALFNGFSNAGDTQGAQAFGAKNYYKVSLIFQKGVIMLGMACFPIWAFWVNIDKILILVKQPRAVAEGTWLYLMIFSPGIIGMFLFCLLRSYIQVQGIVKPNAMCSFIGWVLHILYNYLLISILNLGLVGAAVAIVLTYFTLSSVLAGYIYFSKIYVLTWKKLSMDCLFDWRSYVQLGLSGVIGELLLFSGSEATVFIMGVLSKSDLGAQAVLFQIRSTLLMISVGICVSLCILIGTELGAGNPKRARLISKLGILINVAINLLVAIILLVCRNPIGSIFTKNDAVYERITKSMLFVSLCFFFNTINITITGILLSCAKQRIFTLLFFIGQYVIALPLGTVLAFVAHMEIVGMWIGMATGAFIQCVLSIIYVFWIIDFEVESVKARKRSRDISRPETTNQKSYGAIYDRGGETAKVVRSVNSESVEEFNIPHDDAKRVIVKRVVTFSIFVFILLLSIIIRYTTS